MNRSFLKQLLVLLILGIFVMILFIAGYHYGREIPGGEIDIAEDSVVFPEGETDEPLLEQEAVCVIESYDLDKDELTAEEMRLPVEFIGLTKRDVIDYITSHKELFQEEDEEIKNISMISFEHDRLVLRKEVTKAVSVSDIIIPNENIAYHYYMVIEAGYLVVYKQDKTTVFLETGISREDLSEDDVKMLLEGIGVKNISELYRYLESYTS